MNKPREPDPWTYYTLGEEIANAITHGVGTLLSIAGLTLLVTLAALAHDSLRVWSFAVYGVSLVLLHLASTLYHAIPPSRVKRMFRIVDHSSIYLLIAGTYTPFLVIGLHNMTLLWVVWGLAAAGIGLQVAASSWFTKMSVFTYIGMGWLVIVVFRNLLADIPVGGVVLLIAGGLAYMIGIAFYAWKNLPYHHAIWHVFVMGGSACHFFAIFFYLLPTH